MTPAGSLHFFAAFRRICGGGGGKGNVVNSCEMEEQEEVLALGSEAEFEHNTRDDRNEVEQIGISIKVGQK